jgi:hypothetical protein
MGLSRNQRARLLGSAQDLRDAGRTAEAVALLETTVASLRPNSVATDALIVATLATYLSEIGNPQRGLDLLAQVSLDGGWLSDVHLVCLGARCCCLAAMGDLVGAQRDRERIRAANPAHPALALVDAALGRSC